MNPDFLRRANGLPEDGSLANVVGEQQHQLGQQALRACVVEVTLRVDQFFLEPVGSAIWGVRLRHIANLL